jgi:hypothetical protein
LTSLEVLVGLWRAASFPFEYQPEPLAMRTTEGFPEVTIPIRSSISIDVMDNNTMVVYY